MRTHHDIADFDAARGALIRRVNTLLAVKRKRWRSAFDTSSHDIAASVGYGCGGDGSCWGTFLGFGFVLDAVLMFGHSCAIVSRSCRRQHRRETKARLQRFRYVVSRACSAVCMRGSWWGTHNQGGEAVVAFGSGSVARGDTIYRVRSSGASKRMRQPSAFILSSHGVATIIPCGDIEGEGRC